MIRSVSWFSTDTATPLCGGTVTDCTTRIPPAGSTSLFSTPTSTSPPLGSSATSRTAIGGADSAVLSSTSIRTSPGTAFGPALTRYCM